ncbi:hypothetical protein HHI36_005455 [Cryptolaemus montrouzieri]|uniref:Uncharacterized protein n=1 Tax=Cryptolaemus montrouzieri TaxID=559131 RepID=A0ABD2NUT9_9CUCU
MALYYSNTQSVLTYLLVIWPNTSKFNLSRIQRLQNKALKSILNPAYDLSTNELHEKIPVMRLDKLKELEKCKLIFKLDNKLLKSSNTISKNYMKHTCETRSSHAICSKKVQTELGGRSPLLSSSSAFNALPKHMSYIKSAKLFFKNRKSHFSQV